MDINTKNKRIHISSQFQNGFPDNLEDDPNAEPFWIFFFLLLPQVRISKITTQYGVFHSCGRPYRSMISSISSCVQSFFPDYSFAVHALGDISFISLGSLRRRPVELYLFEDRKCLILRKRSKALKRPRTFVEIMIQIQNLSPAHHLYMM